MLAGKKFSTNEEVIAEIEAFFEAMSKSYTIKMVSKNIMTAIIIVLPSKASILNSLRIYQPNCYLHNNFSPVSFGKTKQKWPCLICNWY
jgi:hypothetical protein